MVIGNGLIANAFKSFEFDEEIIIFASGVSNSSETLDSNFLREKLLLDECLKKYKPNQKFIYFSTCSILDKDLQRTKYVLHKLEMESRVKELNQFFIIRLSNVVGKTKNQFTITNYLYNCIKENKNFALWKNAYRNLIDIDDVYFLVNKIIRNSDFLNLITNVALPFNTSILEIVEIFEKILKKKSKYSFADRGSFYKINIESISKLIDETNLNFDKLYIERVLTKYYEE